MQWDLDLHMHGIPTKEQSAAPELRQKRLQRYEEVSAWQALCVCIQKERRRAPRPTSVMNASRSLRRASRASSSSLRSIWICGSRTASHIPASDQGNSTQLGSIMLNSQRQQATSVHSARMHGCECMHGGDIERCQEVLTCTRRSSLSDSREPCRASIRTASLARRACRRMATHVYAWIQGESCQGSVWSG